jgi:hypothetical protein
MANDPANSPLALSGIAAGPPQEAEYHAVYAAVTATERGRWFLGEFAKRNRHADTGSLVAALARIEAAVGGAEVQSSETTVTSDQTAAAEKVQDIAFQLRERGGDPALCDALDAGAREIAVVSPKAADRVEPAPTAAADANRDAFAGDFEFGLQDRDKFAAAAAALAASLSALDDQTAGDQTVGDQDHDHQTLNGSAPPASAAEESPAAQQTSTAAILTNDYAGDAATPQQPAPVTNNPRWYIEPPDFLFERPPQTNGTAGTPSDDARKPHSLLPGTQFLPNPEEDPAELFESAATIAVTRHVAAAPAAEAEPVLSGSRATAANAETPPSRSPAAPPVRAAARPAPVNPLAALHALTEDEILALFG